MNVADSDEMARYLAKRGWEPTCDPDEATIYLVNTCTVRQHAEDRALSEIGRLRRWKAQKPNRKVVITGCAAERTKEFLEMRFPHIDIVVGARSIKEFGGIVDGLLETQETDESLEYALGVPDGKVSTFVTIMRGCNYSCSYCIVPNVRGRESYRAMDEVIEEVRERANQGVREVTLLGQTVNSYHRGGSKGRDTDFSDLLEAVACVDGIERIRFISPHPYYMTERVIGAMAQVRAVCEGLHLPVQSGSNTILKSMLRNYTCDHYLKLVARLRSAMPDIVISTDLIVGFPGETEEDFRRTLSLIKEVNFDWGFVFKYSPRQGTLAADLPLHPIELIEERHHECLDLVERIGLKRRSRLIGSIQEVLVEEDNFGRTRGNYKMKVDRVISPGDIVRAVVTNVDHATLGGECVAEPISV